MRRSVAAASVSAVEAQDNAGISQTQGEWCTGLGIDVTEAAQVFNALNDTLIEPLPDDREAAPGEAYRAFAFFIWGIAIGQQMMQSEPEP